MAKSFDMLLFGDITSSTYDDNNFKALTRDIKLLTLLNGKKFEINNQENQTLDFIINTKIFSLSLSLQS